VWQLLFIRVPRGTAEASQQKQICNRADGVDDCLCNQYNSALDAVGRFVYAPILVENGSTASVRRSIPDSGEATLKFTNGVLTVVNNTSKNIVPMNCLEFHVFLRSMNYHGTKCFAVVTTAEMSTWKCVSNSRLLKMVCMFSGRGF